MNRIFGAKTYVGVILHVGVVLAIFFLCFDVTAGSRGEGKEKVKGVLVSKPKAKKTEKKREEENVSVVNRTVKGKVGMVTPNFLSIIYKRDKKTKTEYEIALAIEGDLELVNMEELGQIKIGDTIEVRYEERRKTYEETKEDGTVERKTKIVGRGVKKITFLHPEIKGVLSTE